jgi:hypothetical protein
LFPELLPHLQQAFDKAEPGTEFVITRFREANQNLRTQLSKFIKRAGLEPWPKLFHNLRSTQETELAETYPLHVVCSWIGNSQPIAAKHYLQVTDDHFAIAASDPALNRHRAYRFLPTGAAKCAAAHCRNGSQGDAPRNRPIA